MDLYKESIQFFFHVFSSSQVKDPNLIYQLLSYLNHPLPITICTVFVKRNYCISSSTKVIKDSLLDHLSIVFSGRKMLKILFTSISLMSDSSSTQSSVLRMSKSRHKLVLYWWEKHIDRLALRNGWAGETIAKTWISVLLAKWKVQFTLGNKELYFEHFVLWWI